MPQPNLSKTIQSDLAARFRNGSALLQNPNGDQENNEDTDEEENDPVGNLRSTARAYGSQGSDDAGTDDENGAEDNVVGSASTQSKSQENKVADLAMNIFMGPFGLIRWVAQKLFTPLL